VKKDNWPEREEGRRRLRTGEKHGILQDVTVILFRREEATYEEGCDARINHRARLEPSPVSSATFATPTGSNY
jgi:hypothetical protein